MNRPFCAPLGNLFSEDDAQSYAHSALAGRLRLGVFYFFPKDCP